MSATATATSGFVARTELQHSVRRAGLVAGLALMVMAGLAVFANFGVLEALVAGDGITMGKLATAPQLIDRPRLK